MAWCPKNYKYKDGKTLCQEYPDNWKYWVTEKYCKEICSNYRYSVRETSSRTSNKQTKRTE